MTFEFGLDTEDALEDDFKALKDQIAEDVKLAEAELDSPELQALLDENRHFLTSP